MNKFTAKDGSPQQSLSIVQREFILPFFFLPLGLADVLCCVRYSGGAG